MNGVAVAPAEVELAPVERRREAVPTERAVPDEPMERTRAAELAARPQAAELEWLAAARAGDTAAFGHLVAMHRRRVTGVALRITGDPDVADDVAQETFLAAWCHLPSFLPAGDGSFGAWLVRITARRALDVLRRERRWTRLDPDEPDREAGPAVRAAHAEMGSAIERAVLGLPDGLRAAFVLREFEGLTYAEIAAALEIPVGTVMSRLHAARRRLAAELAPVLSLEANR